MRLVRLKPQGTKIYKVGPLRAPKFSLVCQNYRKCLQNFAVNMFKCSKPRCTYKAFQRLVLEQVVQNSCFFNINSISKQRG